MISTRAMEIAIEELNREAKSAAYRFWGWLALVFALAIVREVTGWEVLRWVGVAVTMLVLFAFGAIQRWTGARDALKAAIAEDAVKLRRVRPGSIRRYEEEA